MSNIDAIKIRMYNTGSVGDCILLLFQKASKVSFSMLIDCGGYKTNAASIAPCVQDIHDSCAGKLDLLVVTHQHEDHISGFNLGRAGFDSIQVTNVWMSWVENKNDSVAKILKEKYGKKLAEFTKAAHAAKQELAKLKPGQPDLPAVGKRYNARKQTIDDALELLEFEAGESHGKGLKAGSKTNEDAMNYVKKKGTINYRKPGEVIKDMKGAEGIKFYILGPPRDKDLKFIKIEMSPDELYKLAAASTGDDNELNLSDHIIKSGVTLEAGVSPFAGKYKMDEKQEAAFMKMYKSGGYRWRQIETDWLESTGGLALALTKYINNTSLAMALEFESTGNVILLPADAQSGNWMSWQKPDVMKSLKTAGGKDTNELLANTTFYKVGHHGSHNGTASKSGLDKMTHKNLVAFMPLIKNKVPKAWHPEGFPAEKLYQMLIDKTEGRVVRTDEGLTNDNNAPALRSASLASGAPQLNTRSLGRPGLYFEYTVNA